MNGGGFKETDNDKEVEEASGAHLGETGENDAAKTGQTRNQHKGRGGKRKKKHPLMGDHARGGEGGKESSFLGDQKNL